MMENNYPAAVTLLKRHTNVIELAGADGGLVAVTPAWQGRVMISAGGDGRSPAFGWVNDDFIAAGTDDPHFNNYGGADRFWLGPEAGQFGLWFAKGEPFDVDHAKTPHGFGRGPFELTDRAAASVTMAKNFRVANYRGATFDCAVERTVNVLARRQVAENLRTPVPDELDLVAFESVNTLTNAGDRDWSRRTGLLSIWSLGQFAAAANTTVIVPFKAGDDAALGPKAKLDYFGEIPPDRARVGEEHLLFRCDGIFRSKIGISPRRAKDIFGSYDPDSQALTIVQFSLPAEAARLPYVNSLWQIQDAPFAGDAINSYNDTGRQTPAGAAGTFYELETSSPAAELKPGESITHTHRTCHFVGEFDALNALAEKILSADLNNLPT